MTAYANFVLEDTSELDAAVDCLALRIRRIGPSKRRCHVGASKIPNFDTLTVEINACLMRDDVSRKSCGGGMPRMAYFPEWALEKAISCCRLEDSL